MGVTPMQYLAGMAKFTKGLYDGDVDHGLFWCGQVIGRINDIPTCSELIERTVHEAEEIIKTMAQRFAPPD